jgi:carboxylate-amine ligase
VRAFVAVRSAAPGGGMPPVEETRMDGAGPSLGIEEEYLVVDRVTRDLVAEPSEAFLADCRAALGARVTPEFLRCQVEVGTRPAATLVAAMDELAALRAGVAAAAEAHGYAALAVATHPFARWRDQSHTPRPRYEGLSRDMGLAGRRMLICAMHVHVGVADPDLRIALLGQVARFAPLTLALSASSPFWEGEDTGLASYRIAVFDALPRTGPPDRLGSDAEWRDLVAALVEAGCVEDATKIWWDVRPSWRYPTLETRIADICPRLADAAALVALQQALVAHLARRIAAGDAPALPPRTLLGENRWRAQRHGVGGGLVDFAARRVAPVAEVAWALAAALAPEAEALGVAGVLAGIVRIAEEGTSADRQRAVRAAALAAGATETEAMRAVVDRLAAEFLEPWRDA